jgi:hypothetical protein
VPEEEGFVGRDAGGGGDLGADGGEGGSGGHEAILVCRAGGIGDKIGV